MFNFATTPAAGLHTTTCTIERAQGDRKTFSSYAWLKPQEPYQTRKNLTAEETICIHSGHEAGYCELWEKGEREALYSCKARTIDRIRV